MNDKEIQDLKAQIDQLNELCSEALSSEEEPAGRLDRLGTQILRLQDGTLEKRYALRLQQWLLSDPEALQYYVDFATLTALLHLHFQPDSALQPQSCPAFLPE